MNTIRLKYNLLLVVVLAFFTQSSSAFENPTDSLKKLLRQKQDSEKEWIELSTKLGQLYVYKYPDSAYIYLKSALEKAEITGLSSEIGNCQRLLGEVFFNQGLFQQSLKHHLKANNYYTQANNKTAIAENLLETGMVYYYLRQFSNSEKSYQNALKIFEKLNLASGKANAMGKLGHLCEKKSNFTMALYYQREALKLYKKINDKAGTALILENIGSVYEDREQYKEAFNYFTESLQYNIALGNRKAMVSNYNNLGDIYRKEGDYQQALVYTSKALEEATILKDMFQKSAAYKDLSKTFNLMGDYKKAYENLETGRNIYEEIFNEEGTKQLALMQTLYDIDKKNNEIRLLEKESRYNYSIKAVLLLFIILIVISTVLIISRQRLKIRKNSELIEKNKKLHEKEQALIKAELQNTLLKEKQLTSEVQLKTKELTSNALHLIRKNKLLEDLKVDLETINKNGKEDPHKHVKSLIRKVDYSIIQDNEWDDFRKSFEQVHSDFIKELRRYCPELSSTELRLCSLIKLNISSKDIATMMGITHDSLRVARYRLRKKLMLRREESLSAFIQNI